MEQLIAIKRDLVDSISHDDGRWTPIHYASIVGRDDIVESLIRKYHVTVDKRCHGKTSLMLACIAGHKKVIERLLLAGVNANLQCELTGNTGMHLLSEVSKS